LKSVLILSLHGTSVHDGHAPSLPVHTRLKETPMSIQQRVAEQRLELRVPADVKLKYELAAEAAGVSVASLLRDAAAFWIDHRLCRTYPALNVALDEAGVMLADSGRKGAGTYVVENDGRPPTASRFGARPMARGIYSPPESS
jgi:hypothetical protein